jgi:hypothetical protein
MALVRLNEIGDRYLSEAKNVGAGSGNVEIFIFVEE